MKLEIKTPRWVLPYLKPNRIKGVKGGRASGKSHAFAELLVEEHIINPNLQSVCIREIQKSLKFSAKKLIEDKINELGVSHLFDITLTEIRRKGARGLIIFQGMQDHTADSIKSLEGFDIAWVEEAQNLSKRSLELLEPTIRKSGSEIWFTWNPRNEDDAVEKLFASNKKATLAHVNYTDNPFCPAEMIELAEATRLRDVEAFNHIWRGEFARSSEAQIFRDCFVVDTHIDLTGANGPYYGMDFGFAIDPTAVIECYIKDGCLYITREFLKVGLELDATADTLKKVIPDIDKYVIRADCSRPESISYLKRHGLPRITPCVKGKGSVEDGIAFIKSFDKVVIDPMCSEASNEFKRYSYKVDKLSGDVLPVIEDAHNHLIDALRYALEPIQRRTVRDFGGML